MKKLILAVAGACALAASVSLGAQDLSADLQAWQGTNWMIKAKRVKDEGKDCLRIDVTDLQYELLYRTLIFPRELGKVALDVEARSENIVPGPERIDLGRVQIQFLDSEGDMAGTWPGSPVMLKGSTAWKPFSQELEAPKGAVALNLMAGVYLSKGSIFVRSMKLKAFDKEGRKMEPLPSSKLATDVKGWLPMKVEPEDSSRPLALDYSSLRPAPAGKDGFVKSEGGHFTVGGKPVRFWGVNVAFEIITMDKKDLAAYAERLANLGCNMVRPHHLDNGWSSPLNNIFESGVDHTQSFNKEKIDKLDFFIAECKKRGIYVYLDLITTRKFKKGDEVRDWQTLNFGAKIAAHFNRRLIELQKGYAKLLFEHVNPYTGLRWADDPAIAMMEIINESSLFWRDGYDRLPQSYRDEIEGLFTEWCAKRGTQRPEGKIQALLKVSDPAVCLFLREVQDAYYKEISDYLKKTLGVKFLVAGSNWVDYAGDISSNATLDYIDRHSYWDHPAGGFSETCAFGNKPMLKALSSGNIISANARQRVFGLPLIITEWNFCWPNQYCAEGPLLMAANGLFQDWDGEIIFTLEAGGWGSHMKGCFDSSNKPQIVAPFAASAFMWLRGDVAPGEANPFVPDDPNSSKSLGKDLKAADCIMKRTGVILKEGSAPKDAGLPFGKQISWSPEGVFTVDTPCTKAIMGFAGGKSFELEGASLRFENPFGQIIATSLDNKPLKQSKRILLCAAANAENSKQLYKPFRKGLAQAGEGPVLLEPFKASISLESDAAKASLYAVDWHGRRIPGELPLKPKDGGRVNIALDGSLPYFWFELVLE